MRLQTSIAHAVAPAIVVAQLAVVASAEPGFKAAQPIVEAAQPIIKAAPSDPPRRASAPSRAATQASTPEWRLESSELCRRYRCAASDAGIERLQRLEDGTDGTGTGSAAAAETTNRRRAALELEIRRDCLRELVARGLTVPGANGVTPERSAALETIAGLAHPAELVDAVAVLTGEGYRRNLVASEADVRNALFRALAAEPIYGQRKLVELGTTADDEIAGAAREALPAALSPSAVAELVEALGAKRERTINRAAMIAGAHPAGTLIPSLIQAQFAEASDPKKGDEAWIAIGKTTTYVAGLVPVVGNASGAFQPIPGVVFEGSILRIMESAVTIYRTEVHQALVATIENTTGQPAPPFGFERDRWMAWYRNEYPQLAQAHAREHAEQAIAEGVRTTPPRADG